MDRVRRPRPSGLPAELTSFVGRRPELREVKRPLATTRLLTLTGSGGAGKTRLALRAAAGMSRGFSDGAWLVSMAPVQDPLLVPQAVFTALGVQDLSGGLSLSSLTGYLAGKRMLLVLDNCEHLLDGCAVLASTLLSACPELRLLATSRQALGVAGEVRMIVPPMSLPEAGSGNPVEQALRSDAGQSQHLPSSLNGAPFSPLGSWKSPTSSPMTSPTSRSRTGCTCPSGPWRPTSPTCSTN